MNGWWGSKIVDPAEWETNHRIRYPKAHLTRSSADRDTRADEMYKTTLRFSNANITHIAHIIKGHEKGENLSIMNYREVIKELKRTPQFDQKENDSLIQAIPIIWKSCITETAAEKRKHPEWSLKELSENTPPKIGTWIKTKEGKRKKVLIELQKGKNSADIMRFRKYLGDNYRKEDTSETDKKKKEALPIITIYF